MRSKQLRLHDIGYPYLDLYVLFRVLSFFFGGSSFFQTGITSGVQIHDLEGRMFVSDIGLLLPDSSTVQEPGLGGSVKKCFL